MDTGEEVLVQDSEGHVTSISMAASKMNGDAGIEKQGEEAEEGMHPAAVGAAAGASYLHPLVLEESESDSQYHTWIDHPSSSPEGSWLLAVYFQLWGAGFDDFEVRELFRCKVLPWSKAFQKPVAALAKPEKEKEFEEMHLQSMDDMQIMPSQVGNQDDDSIGGQLQQQILQQVPESVSGRGHHIAAKKIATIVGPS